MEKSLPKIPEMVKTSDTPEMVETPEETMSEHKHNFVPLYMSAITFGLIILAYIYCYLTGIEVNTYREIGAIGISGLLTAACWYLNK